jgi:mannose-1-phosphate guanylyltransferase
MTSMTDVDLSDVYVTILAGGSGTRLWPRSRQESPKQLLNLLGDQSMLQQTIDRVLPLVPAERIYILTGPDHAPLIAGQISIPAENILLEPSPRGTGPCLGLAAIKLRQNCGDGQSVMVSLHADHAIGDVERFRAALKAAITTARQGYIVTVGILPDFPATGFGYIERGELLDHTQDHNVYHVVRFAEKPPMEQAQAFVDSGRFYWNAGYFVWTLDGVLDEFRQQLPEMYTQLDEIAAARHSTSEAEVLQRVWSQIKNTTIDVGIMEHARKVAVVPGDLGWSDIGSWASLHEILPRDAQENVVLGEGPHLGMDTTNSLIYSDGKLVATIGMENVIVVNTKDAVLVLSKDRAQDVSALVKELRARGLEDYL